MQKIKSFQKETVKVMMKQFTMKQFTVKQFTMELIKITVKKLHPDLTWRRKREMKTEAKSGQ
jgi:hypothetical protein